jgi:integrase
LAAIPDDPLGRIERPLYLTATMCGLRQGELVALRWQDVDSGVGAIRRKALLHSRTARHPEVTAVEPGGADAEESRQ